MRRLLILFVDDHRPSRHVAKEFLTDEGYEVSLAANGRDALYILGALAPVVVLTDIQMPEMNGYELLVRIGEVSPTTPVVLMTAHHPIDAARTAKELGAAGFINKPMDLGNLLELVQQVIPGIS